MVVDGGVPKMAEDPVVSVCSLADGKLPTFEEERLKSPLSAAVSDGVDGGVPKMAGDPVVSTCSLADVRLPRLEEEHPWSPLLAAVSDCIEMPAWVNNCLNCLKGVLLVRVVDSKVGDVSSPKFTLDSSSISKFSITLSTKASMSMTMIC